MEKLKLNKLLDSAGKVWRQKLHEWIGLLSTFAFLAGKGVRQSMPRVMLLDCHAKLCYILDHTVRNVIFSTFCSTTCRVVYHTCISYLYLSQWSVIFKNLSKYRTIQNVFRNELLHSCFLMRGCSTHATLLSSGTSHPATREFRQKSICLQELFVLV